ncbi:ROK family transcriptional regulator [Streptomyces formicae]|uniref:ROK family transcriptional regulator n=1 Tax=Streptomyces formicae TaxID=1616117 RepID=A0ABY3WHT2_9ACTN|nr:ROK family transcriptional regulator [Streptomyces formicae]UNM12152.1 ROK family transcriptional regulator [Streptomyces formicae]
MSQPQRWTVRDLRRSNRTVVLRTLHFAEPMSRQELSRLTGLSPATVSNVTADLLKEGVIVEAGLLDSEVGRPRVLLRVNPGHRHIVGIDVGETQVRVALFDLDMEVKSQAAYPVPLHGHDVGMVVERILAGIEAVVDESGVALESVLGVGIGVPGQVEQGPDFVVHAATVGWDAVPLAKLLRVGTPLPLFIDNGAKTMGQAELWFGAGQGLQHAVVVLIGSGVGACIVADGHTYRGTTSSAGEWGHTTIAVNGRACRCGSRGCLEAYIGAHGILGRYRDADPQKAGRAGEEAGGEEARLAELLTAAETSPAERAVVDGTVAYLGAGLGDLVNLFNPERIILGGWAGLMLGRARLADIEAAAKANALSHPFAQTSLHLAELGPDGVLMGAATLVLEQFLNNPTGDTAAGEGEPVARQRRRRSGAEADAG